MPIVTVMALPATEQVVHQLLPRLAEAVAEGLSCPVADVWCSFIPVPAQYLGLVNATAAGQCPIVVIRGRARGDDQVSASMTRAAQAVSDELKVSIEDVWVQWVEVVPGRVFAGGGVIA
jgi:hypothetical protein